MSKGLMLSGAAALLGVLGAFLPWYSFELLGITETFAAWSTSTGKLVLVLALAALALAYFGDKKKSKGMHVGVILIGLFLLFVVYANNPGQQTLVDGINTMYGYWLAAASGLLFLVGGGMGMMKK